MHSIEEAFGEKCNLYEDVLKCRPDADKAALRKAYYRTALKYHPDKNPGNAEASRLFQAVSLAYQILLNPDLRASYDETGVIPSDDPDEDEDDKKGMAEWKDFFDTIFGKVTTSDIDAFASKYKCSDEERRDVLKEFKARKGNLVKMLDFVMLSENRDAVRWVQDYIVPAMESDDGKQYAKFRDTMDKTLKQIERKIEKEKTEKESAAAAMEDEEDDDDEETESEEESPPPKKAKASQKKSPPVKAKPTKAKNSAKKAKENDMSSLIAQIQNKNRGGANVLSSLGARYGVSMDDEDPMSDKEFSKAQAKLKKRKDRS